MRREALVDLNAFLTAPDEQSFTCATARLPMPEFGTDD